MKVLQVVPELNVGGVETGTVDFSKYLVAHGHESIVVSNGGSMVGQLEKVGTRHYVLPVHKKSLWTMIRTIKPLRQLIKNENIDIVHARSRVPAWIAVFACRKTNASFITTCHGYYKSKIFSQVMGWAKLIIVPSQIIGRHMIDTYNVHSESIRCIARGVDLTRFAGRVKEETAQSRCHIAIVGRITPLKGHTYFLKAMAKVIRSVPYAKIWIIGDVPPKKIAYRQELESLVRRLGLENNVEFMGKRSDIPDLLTQVDVMVMSSTEPESFGRVILEAQAIGVPVVATRVGGVVDIIDHGKTGLLVAPRDTDAMAREVIKLVKDKSLAKQFAVAALEKLKEKFTVEKMAEQTIAVYEELIRSMNILVIKLTSIGDVVLITSALKSLRQKFPKATIKCVVSKSAQKVLRNCPYIDELIIFDPDDRHQNFFQFMRFCNYLRREKFDKVIDFQNNKKSHLMAGLAFARESYGYNNGKFSFLLSHPVKENRKDIGPVEHQFEVMKLLDIHFSDKNYLELWPGDKERKYVNTLFEGEWLTNSKTIVGINMAASEKWPTKNWPVEHIAKLCDVLSTKNIRVLITGLEKDRHLVKQLRNLTKSKPAVLIGKTDVLQLAAVIKRCKVFITPDSAPLHVAAAMNVPVIAFFGPTDSRRHKPPARKMVVLERSLECAPCYSGHCRIFTHACMKEISVEMVLKEIEQLLGEKS